MDQLGQLAKIFHWNNLKLPHSIEPTTPGVTSGGKQSVFAPSTVAEAAPQYYWVPNADCLPPEVATGVVVTISQGCFSCLIEIAEAFFLISMFPIIIQIPTVFHFLQC